MIYFLKEYATIAEYAVLCNVKPSAIYDRIHYSGFPTIKIGKDYYINVPDNLPGRKKKSYSDDEWVVPDIEKYKYKEGENSVKPIIKQLVGVTNLADKIGIRSDSIFERIISNKIDGYVIGGLTYINIVDNPPASLKVK